MKNPVKYLFPAVIAFCLIQGCTREGKEQVLDYPVSPVDFTRVELNDGFWKDWVEITSHATIPSSFKKCQETGRIDNFIFAGGIREGKYRGEYGFDDTDVYKIIEGASHSLMIEHNPEMESYLDTLINYIAAAQEDDGYLYTPWTLRAKEYLDWHCCIYSDEGRWVATPDDSHEFYNCGHMYEAAAAHFLATGKRNFLDIAIKNADLVYKVCITDGNNYVSGHQEIEIGLVKLFRITGDRRYLDLAKHLLDIRAGVRDHEYAQYHLPVTRQTEAVGHAVRANYMYTAMADIAALTGDADYMQAIESLWNNVVSKKLSITGGVGAREEGESYGDDYELPNEPYNETCAAIANVYWNHRMFLLTGEGRYMDVLERTLYNGVLPGLSLDGTHFFYPNTLRHDGETLFNKGNAGRSPWFDCSCCPSNLSRFIPSVAGYAYASRGKDVFVNLYMNSRVSFETDEGSLKLKQETSYPWTGAMELILENEEDVNANIHIRIPGWLNERPVPSDLFVFSDQAGSEPVFSLNGDQIRPEVMNGYAIIGKTWSKGDVISVEFPVEVRKVTAHPDVQDKKGLVAIQYGPLVYCAEEIDNNQDVLDAVIGDAHRFEVRFNEDLLGGVNILESEDLKLIPYYAWANRGIGKMNVWFQARP